MVPYTFLLPKNGETVHLQKGYTLPIRQWTMMKQLACDSDTLS